MSVSKNAYREQFPCRKDYVMTRSNFSVPDLFDVCIERCETAQLECILGCGNDLMCLSQCISDAKVSYDQAEFSERSERGIVQRFNIDNFSRVKITQK